MVDEATLEIWSEELACFYNSQVGPHFKRLEARERGFVHVKGLLSETKKRLAVGEASGAQTPDGMQRVLTGSRWDVDGVRDAVRAWLIGDVWQSGRGGHR